MGNYEPAKPGKQRSLSDTLSEAEEDHFLDCPDADFLVRAAALLLDLILFSVATSAIQQLFTAADSFLNHFLPVGRSELDGGLTLPQVLLFLSGVTKAASAYFYFLFSVSRLGGTPGKLLLGLRVLSYQTGSRLAPPATFLREILGKALSVVTVIGCLMPLYRKDHRALHDLVSGSVVKKVRGGP